MAENDMDKTGGEHDREVAPSGFEAVEMDVDEFHNKGIDYLEAKDYERAAEMFRKEAGCPGGRILGNWFLGKALAAMGKGWEARKAYEKALRDAEKSNRRDPGSVEASEVAEMRRDLEAVMKG